jgi:phthalate 4,5-cis-dihydrodiol dehydrogenase
MVFNGYGRFSMTELTWGIAEGGKVVDPYDRVRMTAAVDPNEKYTSFRYTPEGMEEREKGRDFQPFYGLTLVSCERGDIRQSPNGLYVYTDDGRTEVPCPPPIGHAAELEELYAAITEERPAFPDARWGMGTLEVCLAILESSRTHQEVKLSHQVSCPF